jgi:hypothetical protein
MPGMELPAEVLGMFFLPERGRLRYSVVRKCLKVDV